MISERGKLRSAHWKLYREMKRIPARKYPIFAALIAVIAVSALIGSALFLPGNRNPDKSRLSAAEISRTETDSDSADRHTADNSSQEKNENQISAPEKDSGQAEQQKAESPAPKQAPSAKASGQAAVRDSNHTDTQGKNKDAAAPRQQPSEPSGAQSDTSARYAYLTFDDGPSRNTDAILKILAENNIKATFFVTARNTDATNMQRYRRIVEAGHTLAMHSGTHNYREVYASREAFLADYAKISDLVYEITGTRSVIYRFPGEAAILSPAARFR